jgi:hypothetical protein
MHNLGEPSSFFLPPDFLEGQVLCKSSLLRKERCSKRKWDFFVDECFGVSGQAV